MCDSSHFEQAKQSKTHRITRFVLFLISRNWFEIEFWNKFTDTDSVIGDMEMNFDY